MDRHDETEDYDFFRTPGPGSPLFRVMPHAPTGAFRESLSSLIVRIARAHSVSPRDMLFEIVARHYDEIGRICKGTFFRHYSAPINGLGKYAELFSTAISNLASLPHISRHTLLPLRNTLASQGSPVIHQGQRWCADCLRDMVVSDIEPHRPLLWSLAAVTHCPIHQRRLDERCPCCDAEQPVIPRWPDLDYCDSCRSSLLSATPTVQSTGNLSELDERAKWNLRAYLDLLENLHRIEPQHTHASFRQFINVATQTVSAGNRAELCRRIGLSVHALNKWVSGKDKPTLDSFVRLLYALNIFPSQVLFSDCHPDPRTIRIARQVRPKRRTMSGYRPAEDHSSLQSVLACDMPPPLSQIAAGINLSRSGLKYRYPEFCKEITDRRRAHLRAESNRRLAERKEFIVNLVTKSWHAGIVPGKDFVESELRKRGCSLLSKELRHCYHGILARIMGNNQNVI